MAAQIKQRLTPEEYFALDDQAEFKSEYRDGEMIAMAGGEPAHSAIGVNVTTAFKIALRGKPCQVFNSDLRVQVGTVYTYPDATIVCGEQQYGGPGLKTLQNPTIVVEVLSPSTEAYDRGEKFARFRRIEALTDYLLVAQDRARIEHYARQSGGLWLLAEAAGLDAAITIGSVNCELCLADVYDQITFDDSVTM